MTWFPPNAKTSTKGVREGIISRGLAHQWDLAWAWRINRNGTGSEVGGHGQNHCRPQEQMRNWLLCPRGKPGRGGPPSMRARVQQQDTMLRDDLVPTRKNAFIQHICPGVTHCDTAEPLTARDNAQLKPPSSHWGEGRRASQNLRTGKKSPISWQL